MPTSSEFERKVRAYLEENYNVTSLEPTRRGEHLAFALEINGIKRVITLNEHNAHGPRGEAQCLQDIRRIFGQPQPNRVSKEPRKLEDMMPTPPFNPPKILPALPDSKKEATGTGWASSYQSNGCLTFVLPPEIVACVDTTLLYSAIKVAKGFEIKPGGNSKIRLQGKHMILCVSGRLTGDPPKYFAKAPTEYVAMDGHILANYTLSPDQLTHKHKPRLGVIKPLTKEVITTPKVIPVTVLSKERSIAPTIPNLLNYLKSLSELNEQAIKEVVDCVNYIEDRTPWKINRSTTSNRLIFQSRIE
jgi:hypothetical protein